MTERLDEVGAEGDWSIGAAAVNSLIDDLVRPTTEAARVIAAVAEGDLTQQMALDIAGQPVRGEFLRIGTTVNTMVDQLSAFAAEVTRVAREVGELGLSVGEALRRARDLVDDALLLVTELVTNAVVHAGTDVELHVDTGAGRARIEVVDHGAGSLPVLRVDPDEAREGGRGIFLLDALAQEWGTRNFSGGKSVWFVLGVTDRVAPRPLPLRRARGGDRAPAPAVMSWLLGLPADLEERLSPSQLLGELLHRLCGAMDLCDGWLMAESPGDQTSWEVVATHDATGSGPSVDSVRRVAREGYDQVL